MTITQMQYFVAVCEHGSISRAAEALHVSQPSISMAIKDLEGEFGITLFYRSNKRFEITHEGTFAYDYIKDVLNRIDTFEVLMRDIGKQQKVLRLGIPNLTGVYLVNSFLNDFHDEYPDVSFEISQCASSMAFKMLENGGFGVAIVVEPEAIPEQFEHVRIMTSEFVYCVAPDHPLAGMKEVSLTDIQNDSLIMNSEESFLTKQVKKRFYANGFVPKILLYAVQLPLIREFVQNGRAGTFFTRELAQSIPGIVAIPLKEKIPVHFSLVWNKTGPISKSTRALIDYIIKKSENGAINI